MDGCHKEAGSGTDLLAWCHPPSQGTSSGTTWTPAAASLAWWNSSVTRGKQNAVTLQATLSHRHMLPYTAWNSSVTRGKQKPITLQVTLSHSHAFSYSMELTCDQRGTKCCHLTGNNITRMCIPYSMELVSDHGITLQATLSHARAFSHGVELLCDHRETKSPHFTGSNIKHMCIFILQHALQVFCAIADQDIKFLLIKTDTKICWFCVTCIQFSIHQRTEKS